MSVINRMLQDLEKRRASGAERDALPDQVRVLPREETHAMPWRRIGLAAAVALIALLAWRFDNRPPSTSPLAQTQTRPEQLPEETPAAALRPGSPALRLAPELERIPPAAGRAPARSVAGSQAGAAASDAPTRRKSAAAEVQAVTTEKSAPPPATAAVLASEPAVTAKPALSAVKAEPAKPAAASAETPKPASAAPTAPVAAAGAATKPAMSAPRTVEVLPQAKVQAAPANPQIDKRLQTLTPRQLAENDYREAANLLNQGRLAEAQEGFRRALQHNPAHVGARQGLLGLLLDAGEIGEAEQLLQEGLKLNPNQPGFAMALASLQYERGEIAGAIETMQKSAPAAQASPDYLARLAGLLQRQSRHEEAIEYYQAALRLAPGSGVWLMGLGISLQASNRGGEAQDAFRRARATNTLNAELQAFVDQRLKQLQ